jgi:hypothetical protein
MKNSNKFIAVFIGFLLICTKTYGIESKFSTSYRCVSNFAGGVHHSADGHRATEYSERSEFRLIHFNDLKDSTVELWPRLTSLHQVSDTDLGYYEEGAYFFRDTTVPEVHIVFGPKCTSFGEDSNGVFATTSISCNNSKYLFQFSPDSSTFIYAYIGAYVPTGGSEAEKYYGDSSVFEYGTCSPYYD